VPHPYSPVLEDVVRPNRNKIVAAVRNMLGANVGAATPAP